MPVMLCFLPADSSLLESHWLNRAAAAVAPSGSQVPKIHVELLFVDKTSSEDICGDACSIHYNGNVFLEPKRFTRSQWQFRELKCTPMQARQARDFCQTHVGEGFNHLGYFLHPVMPCQVTPHTMQRFKMSSTPRWYCSEIVAAAINHAGIMDVPVSCHPEKLFQSIKESTAPSCPRSTELQFK